LCGPALGHRVFATERAGDQSSPIVLQLSNVVGVKVVPWPEDMKPDMRLPVVPSSVFLSWPLNSWLLSSGDAATVSTPLPALIGFGMNSVTGKPIWFYLPVTGEAIQSHAVLTRPLIRAPRQEMNPYVRLIDADSLPAPLSSYLKSDKPERQRLCELCDWYSRRIAFGTGTHEMFHHADSALARSRVREQLFQSSAPLELYCYQECVLLADLLGDFGCSVRLLHLDYEPFPAMMHDRRIQHWVAEIRLGEGDRWLFVDPSLGVFGLTSADGRRVVDWLRVGGLWSYRLPLVTLKPRWVQYTWEIASRRLHDAAVHGPSLACVAIAEYLRAFDYGAFLACRLRGVREYAPHGWSQIVEVTR
ncbi:MAG TPA: hypothetical protein PKO06_02495, partial [Candidatus Ozemobacteraceae bacterium]|nr:hypothetical protein [Candidatus Ozemobacteraceae bacterium]